MPLYGIAWPEGKYLYVCGGGGGASSGIRNRLVIAKSKKGCLTDQLGEYDFGHDCPMRMAVCPGGKSIIVAMGLGGIKHLEVDLSVKKKPRVVEATGPTQAAVAAIRGDIKALAFDGTGSHLALGCSDGTVHVLTWPELTSKLDLSGDAKLLHGVRDLDLSRAAPVLAVVLEDGTCELHDWAQGKMLARLAPGKDKLRGERIILETGPSSTVVHHLPKGAEAISFRHLSFSRDPAHGGDLYCILNHRGSGAWLACWQGVGVTPQEIRLARVAHVCRDPGTSLAVSRDAQLIAVGTSEGTMLGVRASDLTVVRTVPKAHLVFSTCAAFADAPGPAGHQALSASADASVYVLPLAGRGGGIARMLLGVLMFLMLLTSGLLASLTALSASGHDASLQRSLAPLASRLGLPDTLVDDVLRTPHFLASRLPSRLQSRLPDHLRRPHPHGRSEQIHAPSEAPHSSSPAAPASRPHDHRAAPSHPHDPTHPELSRQPDSPLASDTLQPPPSQPPNVHPRQHVRPLTHAETDGSEGQQHEASEDPHTPPSRPRDTRTRFTRPPVDAERGPPPAHAPSQTSDPATPHMSPETPTPQQPHSQPSRPRDMRTRYTRPAPLDTEPGASDTAQADTQASHQPSRLRDASRPRHTRPPVEAEHDGSAPHLPPDMQRPRYPRPPVDAEPDGSDPAASHPPPELPLSHQSHVPPSRLRDTRKRYVAPVTDGDAVDVPAPRQKQPRDADAGLVLEPHEELVPKPEEVLLDGQLLSADARPSLVRPAKGDDDDDARSSPSHRHAQMDRLSESPDLLPRVKALSTEDEELLGALGGLPDVASGGLPHDALGGLPEGASGRLPGGLTATQDLPTGGSDTLTDKATQTDAQPVKVAGPDAESDQAAGPEAAPNQVEGSAEDTAVVEDVLPAADVLKRHAADVPPAKQPRQPLPADKHSTVPPAPRRSSPELAGDASDDVATAAGPSARGLREAGATSRKAAAVATAAAGVPVAEGMREDPDAPDEAEAAAAAAARAVKRLRVSGDVPGKAAAAPAGRVGHGLVKEELRTDDPAATLGRVRKGVQEGEEASDEATAAGAAGRDAEGVRREGDGAVPGEAAAATVGRVRTGARDEVKAASRDAVAAAAAASAGRDPDAGNPATGSHQRDDATGALSELLLGAAAFGGDDAEEGAEEAAWGSSGDVSFAPPVGAADSLAKGLQADVFPEAGPKKGELLQGGAAGHRREGATPAQVLLSEGLLEDAVAEGAGSEGLLLESLLPDEEQLPKQAHQAATAEAAMAEVEEGYLPYEPTDAYSEAAVEEGHQYYDAAYDEPADAEAAGAAAAAAEDDAAAADDGDGTEQESV